MKDTPLQQEKGRPGKSQLWQSVYDEAVKRGESLSTARNEANRAVYAYVTIVKDELHGK